jgi:hypothetical protein
MFLAILPIFGAARKECKKREDSEIEVETIDMYSSDFLISK